MIGGKCRSCSRSTAADSKFGAGCTTSGIGRAAVAGRVHADTATTTAADSRRRAERGDESAYKNARGLSKRRRQQEMYAAAPLFWVYSTRPSLRADKASIHYLQPAERGSDSAPLNASSAPQSARGRLDLPGRRDWRRVRHAAPRGPRVRKLAAGFAASQAPRLSARAHRRRLADVRMTPRSLPEQGVEAHARGPERRNRTIVSSLLPVGPMAYCQAGSRPGAAPWEAATRRKPCAAPAEIERRHRSIIMIRPPCTAPAPPHRHAPRRRESAG